MKELSLNILDIAMNSVKAKAKNVSISIMDEGDTMSVVIKDNGSGMSQDTLKRVTDPFYTTRTTRKVGLGIPFYILAAEQTGGKVEIISQTEEPSGTTVSALFYKNHIDCLPLGDIISTFLTLIQGNPNIDFLFTHNSVNLNTKELKEVLGDVPLSSPEVLVWIREFLEEQYKENNK